MEKLPSTHKKHIDCMTGKNRKNKNESATRLTIKAEKRHSDWLNTLTLENVVASKLGYVRVMRDEVFQKAGELVSLPKCHVTPHEVLMHHTQVEVVAE